MSDFYQILGVKPDTNLSEIRKAYRKLATMYHPDKPCGNEEKFKEISLAYSVLSDPERRQSYDRSGRIHDRSGRIPEMRGKTYQVDSNNDTFNSLFKKFFGNQSEPSIDPVKVEAHLVPIDHIYHGINIEKGCPEGTIINRDGVKAPLTWVNNTPYQVKGHDLYLRLEINADEAKSGIKRNIRFIDKSIYQIKSQQAGRVIYKQGGMPIYQSSSCGDLIVDFVIK